MKEHLERITPACLEISSSDTKLARVQKELIANDSLYVSEPLPTCYTLCGNQYRGPIYFRVAPLIPIYTEVEMNQFLKSVIKETKPTAIDEAHEYKGEYGRTIKLGVIHFEEKVGTRIIPQGILKIEIEDAREHLNHLSGLREENKELDLIRDIEIRLYPHPALAKLLHEYGNSLYHGRCKTMSHPDCDLEFYRERVDEKMINYLKNKPITTVNPAELPKSL